MNCIGPTARSQTGSRSIVPPSESWTTAVLLLPLSGIPKIPGRTVPHASRPLPAYRPWSLSILPIAAISAQSMPHAGSAAPTSWAPRWWASRAWAGMPLAVAADGALGAKAAGRDAAEDCGGAGSGGSLGASLRVGGRSGTVTTGFSAATVPRAGAPPVAASAAPPPMRATAGRAAPTLRQICRASRVIACTLLVLMGPHPRGVVPGQRGGRAQVTRPAHGETRPDRLPGESGGRSGTLSTSAGRSVPAQCRLNAGSVPAQP